MAKRSAVIPVIHGLLVGSLLMSGCAPKGKGSALTASTGGITPVTTRDRDERRPVTPPGTSTPNNPNPATGETPDGQTPERPPLVVTPPTTPTTSSGSSGSSATIPSLVGTVNAPQKILADSGSGIISNNGSAIISNNGSAIISNNGSAIISNNGGAIISNNGSAIISNNGGAYRVLDASPTEGFLANAFLYLTNRDEKFYLNTKTNSVFATTTNAQGRYDFSIGRGSGFPVGKDVIVNALINGNLRLSGYMTPNDEDNSLKVNLGSTLATEFLRGEAYRLGQSLNFFDFAKFVEAVSMTDAAIVTGDIAAVRTRADLDDPSLTVEVGSFDLRIDHLTNLRNQYAIALSAADVANDVIKALSDKWKDILGERPASVTSLIGNGRFPTVSTRYVNAGEADAGIDYSRQTPLDMPIGHNYGVAVANGGDVFLSCYTQEGGSGHIRWIRKGPDGKTKVSTLWTPTYAIVAPFAVTIQTDAPPGTSLDDAQHTETPGRLLVVDNFGHKVYSVAIVDDYNRYGDDGNERFSIQIIAGMGDPVWGAADPYYGYQEVDHPDEVEPGHYAPVDNLTPATSTWRRADEGSRVYETGPRANGVIDTPARYAHLNLPTDAAVDKLGNIYISEQGNHRVRMIPSQAAIDADPDDNFFDYQAPVMNGDGTVASFSGTKAAMQAGCIYTIVGNPAWEDNSADSRPGRWLGDYLQPSNSRAQEARLDQPYALAFFDESGTGLGKLYIADLDNNRIRVVSRETGLIANFAGNPPGVQVCAAGDCDFPIGTNDNGGLAVNAELSYPRGLAVDSLGKVFIADTDSGRLRMVGLDGRITTLAGRTHTTRFSTSDNSNDGEARYYADLYETEKIDLDPNGNLIFQDYRHHRARKLWRQWD